MVSRESNLTWPIAKEFLRAVFSVERKLTGISNWEKRHSTLEWILKKYINEERDKTPAKIIILDLNQNRHWLICYEEGRYFILKIFNLLPFQTWRGRYFFRVLFYLEMSDKMWQGVIDSSNVVGCHYLFQRLTSASSHCEGGAIWSLCEHSYPCTQILYEMSIKNSENFRKFFYGWKVVETPLWEAMSY